MKVYLDNVIVCGRIREDLRQIEMDAVRKLYQGPYRTRVKLVTSRESWREQERTTDPNVRAALSQSQPAVPVVEDDHRVLGFSNVQDQYGGFIAGPLVTDVVDETLFAAFKSEGLKDADARHLMYATRNGCERFVTLDDDFIARRDLLAARCGALRIVKPSELIAELSRGSEVSGRSTGHRNPAGARGGGS